MARILLISANNHCVPYPVYPIGLAYISTYLKEKMPESELRLFDVNKGNSSDLEALINKFQPQYTGISFRNIDDANSMNKESFIEDYRNLVNQIRLLSDSIIIAGGAGFSLFAEVLYKELQPDYGVYGEGEASLVSLIKSLETGGNPNTIPGLVFADKEKVVVNRDRNQYSDLRLNFDDQLIDYYWDKSGMLNIQTKRGCPHSCIYCSYPVIEGTKVRNLNPDKIVQTLVHLYRDKKVNYVFFTDSVFNLGKSYNRELAEKIIETGIHMKWGAYFSPKDLDVETLSLFKKAGLKHIEFGTESMSNAVLKSYNKHFTVKDVLDVSENCNVAGVYFAHFLILGGYGETNETVQ
ncbi:MAG: B12-binding domain-containing radical SAM protein [Marinilabiliales bacterium]|nr:MAG: B12-binding domain-containing radical SAM protein [Marinilabiliales bacterium]